LALKDLLPKLEEGIQNGDWRIRHASVTLLGDMMYHISGVSGKGTTQTQDEDQNFGTEEGLEKIAERIGAEHRNNILAGLYLGRNDVEYQVRTVSVHVWKVVVSNTARTLKTILPNLITLVVNSLASEEEDTQETAAKCLGDLVKKLGDRLLPDIIPILENDLQSPYPTRRRGICNGLAEIVAESSDEVVDEYAGKLVPTLQLALSDADEFVQSEAGKIFDSLLDKLGDRALEEIIPPIIDCIKYGQDSEATAKDKQNAENAMGSLKALVHAQPRVVAKYLVPKLTEPPVNTSVLAFLGKQVPDTFLEHLKKIVRAVVNAMVKVKREKPNEPEEYEAIRSDASQVVSAANEKTMMRIQLDELIDLTRDSEKPLRRTAACELLAAISNDCPFELDQIQHQLVLKNVFKFLCYQDTDLTDACWSAVEGLMRRIKPAAINKDTEFSLDEADDLKNNIGSIRDSVRTLITEMKRNHVPPSVGMVGAKNRKKALEIFIPVLKAGLNRQQSDVRESTANALSDLIKLFSPTALAPSFINITGALVKALGDKWAASVKSATINAISETMKKAGIKLIAFAPQLQTILVKNLKEGESKTRKCAAIAIGHLAGIHKKKDHLLKEVLKEFQTLSEPDLAMEETYLLAVRLFLDNTGAPGISEESGNNLIATLRTKNLTAKGKKMAAGCLGVLSAATKHAALKDALSVAEIETQTDDLGLACEAAFLAASVKANFKNEEAVLTLTSMVKKRGGSEVYQFAAQAAAFILNQMLLSKNKGGSIPTQLIESTYKMMDNSHELRMKFWEGMTWAVYAALPIQIEVDTSKLCTEVVVFMCTLAEKCGGKSELSVQVKTAADRALLAFISQCGLDYVTEVCEADGSVAVTNAIGTRLAKNSVVANKEDNISIVPMTVSNIDGSMI